MTLRILKWVGISMGVILFLLASVYTYIAVSMNNRIEQTYHFKDEPLRIPTDSVALARGRHLVAIKGCQDCHGADLGGKVMNDDAPLGQLVASNLTKGAGGLRHDYSEADWFTALRHGVGQDGKPLIFMPSHETTLLSEEDMSALIAYCDQVPPVNRSLPENALGPVALVMSFMGKMPLLSVEKIDHQKPMVVRVDSVEGIALGKYLAVSCSGCHRPDMKGGEPLAPGFPPVPDITSAGNVGRWSDKQFITTLTTGKTPEGHVLKNEDMPWKMTAQYTQTELASLYKYLRSI
ncbi:c-type cytochrome [Dyadobacter crusticola]|uniref:c-type cytochrome n=1 Tax=Dyadobacter crusticola TaxID=292407 RepID=UPI0004E28C10|nr:cytochrome c [Dyadobacter crusticola]